MYPFATAGLLLAPFAAWMLWRWTKKSAMPKRWSLSAAAACCLLYLIAAELRISWTSRHADHATFGLLVIIGFYAYWHLLDWKQKSGRVAVRLVGGLLIALSCFGALGSLMLIPHDLPDSVERVDSRTVLKTYGLGSVFVDYRGTRWAVFESPPLLLFVERVVADSSLYTTGFGPLRGCTETFVYDNRERELVAVALDNPTRWCRERRERAADSSQSVPPPVGSASPPPPVDTTSDQVSPY